MDYTGTLPDLLARNERLEALLRIVRNHVPLWLQERIDAELDGRNESN